MLWAHVQMLAWVFGLGFVAAAPIGPVNTVAIHRGIMGRWKHTVACGLGSALVDSSYLMLVLLGGRRLQGRLRDPGLQNMLAIAGFLVLVPLAGRFLYRAYRYNRETHVRLRRKMRHRTPQRLWSDLGAGVALTVFNPMTPVFWVGAGAHWVSRAQTVLPNESLWWGGLSVFGGQMLWFSILAVLVRFVPNRLGHGFFRVVHGFVGALLALFALACLWTLVDHYLLT